MSLSQFEPSKKIGSEYSISKNNKKRRKIQSFIRKIDNFIGIFNLKNICIFVKFRALSVKLKYLSENFIRKTNILDRKIENFIYNEISWKF